MNKRNYIFSIVLNIVLVVAVLSLLHFRYIYVKSDEYAMESFTSIADVVCEDIKKGGASSSDYLYKWCTQQRVTDEEKVQLKKLDSTCNSNYYGVSAKHYESWNCLSSNNIFSIKNSANSISITVNDEKKGQFCVEGLDDGCAVSNFLETEFTSLEMYEDNKGTLGGELYGTIPAISTRNGITYIKVKFDNGKKIGELTELQKQEITEIVKSFDLGE